jgi:Protein of unknown function (DUF2723)
MRVPVLTAAAVFALYAVTAAPGVGWLDTAELVAASSGLGIPHPPGHPVPTFVGRAFQLLPLGDQVLRAGWGAAAAGALAAGLVAALVLRLTRHKTVAGIAGVAFALAPAVWNQAVRPEVYALNAALVLGGILGGVAYLEDRDRRGLPAAGLCFALALGAHHFVAGLAFLPLAAVVVTRRPPVKALLLTAGFGGLGLFVFAYLPLRAATDPLINWGDPRDLERFLWVVSAKAFQKSVGGASDFSFAASAGDTAAALLLALGPLGILLCAGGAWLAVRKPAGVALVAVLLLGALGRAVLGFDFDNPDAFGYLVPAFGAAAVLAGIALARLVAWRRWVLVVALGWPLALLVLPLPARDPRGAEDWAHAVLDPLPPRTLVVTSYNETTFLAWALLAVEGARPDLTVVDRNLMTHVGMTETTVRRHPELTALLRAPLRGGFPLPIAELDRLVDSRPVAVELAVNLEASERLVPWGAVAWYRAAPVDRLEAERADDRRAETLRAGLGDEHGAQRVFVWNQWLTARFYCAIGRREAGLAALARAEAAAGGVPDATRDAICTP